MINVKDWVTIWISEECDFDIITTGHIEAAATRIFVALLAGLGEGDVIAITSVKITDLDGTSRNAAGRATSAGAGSSSVLKRGSAAVHLIFRSVAV